MKKKHSVISESKKREFVLNRKRFERDSGQDRNSKRKKKYKKTIPLSIFSEQQKYRSHFVSEYYRPTNYKKKSEVIKIDGEFGIEEPQLVQNFLVYAMELLNSRARMMTIDFGLCTRVWPSAVTLLCALKQWTELSGHRGQPQQIAQFPSESGAVNSYLYHCGFYDYVKIKEVDDLYHYSPSEIVKIKREHDGFGTSAREDELKALLVRYSDLSPDEIEVFYDRISTEIFNNVTEHGIYRRDSGWWMLAQFHETHEIISVCIADNGIGIRNSLVTGPQRNMILKELASSPDHDGMFIKKAMERNISGAITAPEKKKEWFGIVEYYEQGQRRGKGLQRIKENCRALGIRLAILSCKGYYILDEHGKEEAFGSNGGKVFAGTMYHLTIKTRRSQDENYKYRDTILKPACQS
jgi:hypothetical protein